MAIPSNPITRKEQYLAKAAGQSVSIPDEPLTREEEYLDKIARGGGGGGGTTDYEDLSNKPTLNNVTLEGDLSLSDLGIQEELEAGDNITIEDGVISASGGGEVVEMTYAQYQALTPQQKMDGTVRYVSDYPSGGGGGGGGSLPDYSTTEHKTGQKWIDGKDIYERVIPFRLNNTMDSAWTYISAYNYTHIDYPIGVISQVITADVIRNQSGGHQTRICAGSGICEYNPLTGAFYLNIPQDYTSWIILQYTKA